MNLLNKIKYMTLRSKFIVAISILIIACGASVSYYLISRQINATEEGLIEKGAALIKILATNCEYGTFIENGSILDEIIGATAESHDITYVVVQNKTGDILTQKSKENISIPETYPIITKKDELSIRKLSEGEGDDYYYELICPIITSHSIVSKETLGAIGESRGRIVTEVIGNVRLGVSVAETNDDARKHIRGAVIIILLVISGTILISFWFISRITRPIEKLASASKKIAQGDLSLKMGLFGKDEIGQLATAFDSMVDSLKQSRIEIEEYNRTLEEKIIERTRELEEAQSQLIQTEKMAAIGQLSAGVAHELNNPLGGILGYSQYALEKMNRQPLSEVTEKDFEAYKKHLNDIETQTRRCKTIVQNLLKFSRSSSIIDKSDVDINATLLETIGLIKHQLSMRKINLATDIQDNIPNIQGNAGMLQQVFTNMIINAHHAMKEGGNLLIKSRYSPELGEFAGAIEISFADDGCGIPDEIQNNIFEPFFTTKPIGQGTGLGLSVSFGIIREHGGEIKVRSKENLGTTFTIILPLEKDENMADIDYDTQKMKMEI